MHTFQVRRYIQCQGGWGRGTVGQRAFEAPLQILEVFDADAAAGEQLAGDCSMRRSALLFLSNGICEINGRRKRRESGSAFA